MIVVIIRGKGCVKLGVERGQPFGKKRAGQESPRVIADIARALPRTGRKRKTGRPFVHGITRNYAWNQGIRARNMQIGVSSTGFKVSALTAIIICGKGYFKACLRSSFGRLEAPGRPRLPFSRAVFTALRVSAGNYAIGPLFWAGQWPVASKRPRVRGSTA